LIATSQKLAALTWMTAAASSKADRVLSRSRGWSTNHRRKTCVSRRSSFGAEAGEDSPGQRRVKVGGDPELSLEAARAPRWTLPRLDTGDRLAAARDHYLVAPLHPFQEPGEVSLGLMDVDDLRHGLSLVEFTHCPVPIE
jgi:hypothetical protein